MKIINNELDSQSNLGRWWLAISIPVHHLSHFEIEPNKLSLYPSTTDPQEVKESVEQYWNIHSRSKAIETIQELLQCQYFGQVWQPDLTLRACCSERAWQNKTEKQEDNIRAEELRFVDTVYSQSGSAGFFGWDLARGAYLTRQCYFLGYIDKDETLFILNQYSFAIQRYYSSWKSYLSSVIYGRMTNIYLNDRDNGDAVTGIVALIDSGYGQGYLYSFHHQNDTINNILSSIDWKESFPYLEVPETLQNNTLEETK